jgi:xanthine dehydrogenase YagR molybdenum-binding subunit
MSCAIGAALDRVDGRLKVTGQATYVAEFAVKGLTHAALVLSRIAHGRITQLDTSDAESAPGVLCVITHRNAARIPRLKSAVSEQGAAVQTVLPLQNDLIHHAGQPVAVVVAETYEQAQYAAELVNVQYEAQLPRTRLEQYAHEAYPHPPMLGVVSDYLRGDPPRALSEADVCLEETYTTPIEHHNPMEPHATIAAWDGIGKLTVYETTQGVHLTRQGLAEAFELPVDKVRVICPFVGGGFGAKNVVWPYTILTAIAARDAGRPVKLVLTRAQMFVSAGYRSQTHQKLKVGARHDGTLTAIAHHATAIGSEVGEFPETAPEVTKILYACPNVETSVRLVRLDVGAPSNMRAPGEAPGSFALESALDELAAALHVDPIKLRLRNYAEADPDTGMPWSSKALRACYAQGAERFAWGHRNPAARSMRDGRLLVGWGMATASYPSFGFPAAATAAIRADGCAMVRSGTAELGTGQYTVLTQIASDALGLEPEHVVVQLGDTEQPFSLGASGSSSVRSVGPAVRLAAEDARNRVVHLALEDEASPLFGYGADAIAVERGDLFVRHEPARRESYVAILARQGLVQVTGTGTVDQVSTPARHRVNAFGAQFVEVRVDPDFGLVRIHRALGVFDVGRVINPKTARSQAIGGMVLGIGMALLEHTQIHPELGKAISPNLAGYLLPVHADVPQIEATFIEVADPYVNSLGAKGAGEIGVTGMAAAIANAVYHATGHRIRNLPITPEALL